MNQDKIKQEVYELILAETLYFTVDDLAKNPKLNEVITNSLDHLNLLYAIEEKFLIYLEEDEQRDIIYIDDLVNIICNKQIGS